MDVSISQSGKKRMTDALEHWWNFPEAWSAPIHSISAAEINAELDAEVGKLRAEIEKLKKALRFYRDATAYELDMDCGERARKALGEGEYANHRS